MHRPPATLQLHTLKNTCLAACCMLLLACGAGKRVVLQSPRPAGQRMTGTAFYKTAASFNWRQRDSLAVQQILAGNIPAFFKKFVPVTTACTDGNGVHHKAVLYVSPDYVCVGTDADWARVPLTPMAAEKIAGSLHCFLPTPHIVDLVYAAAAVKLEPVPMYAYRDSGITLWQHHLIIEGQRRGRRGLIAGIKKDVVISDAITQTPLPNRVAIYGWHRLNGQPIQPLYTGHINWYVDYSHGIRLVYETMMVDGKPLHYEEVLHNPALRPLICSSATCSFVKYIY